MKDGNGNGNGNGNGSAPEDNERTKKDARKVHVPLKMTYGPGLWIFFGRNNADTLQRSWGTYGQCVAHDGTWHYQLSGIKDWHLRCGQQKSSWNPW